MISKMKYSVYLFLLLFMLTTSSNKIWKIQNNERIFVDDFTSLVDHKESYIFLMTTPHYISVIYMAGAQSKPYRKYITAMDAVDILKDLHKAFARGRSFYFRRITSDSTINRFADVQKWEYVFEKIPRLYVVANNDIHEVPLIPEVVSTEDTFLLHDGSTVTVYYSHSSSKKKRNLAKSFADYIVKFEKGKHYVDTHISEFDGKKNSKTVSEEFVKTIIENVEIHRESKTNSFQENDVGNSETINESYANLNISYDEEDKKFEKLKKNIYKYYGGIEYPTWKDTEDYERVLSSAVASTSSASTTSASTSEASTSEASTSEASTSSPSFSTSSRRKKEAKLRITKKGKRNTALNVGASAKDPGFMSMSSKMAFGGLECNPQNESVLSSCVYVIIDVEYGESLVYFGQNSEEHFYRKGCTMAEIFLDRYPSANVSYIVDDGNLLPPNFIIHFKNEFKKILKK